MMEQDFSFERSAFEAALAEIAPGGSISAAQFLTLMEGESEDAVQEALMELEVRHICLDVADLAIDVLPLSRDSAVSIYHSWFLLI